VGIVHQRAKYIAQLMPTLSKGIAERVPLYRHSVENNLTISQMYTLGFLHHHGPETMGAMARCTHVALSTMTESVNRLVKMGLVTRIPDEKDRRVIRAQLTLKGQHMFRRQLDQNQELFVLLLKSLSEADQKKLVAAFHAIESILLSPKTVGANQIQA
jgi:MarR family transcriptional regulator, organic hydroperoxide resistance regulator